MRLASSPEQQAIDRLRDLLRQAREALTKSYMVYVDSTQPRIPVYPDELDAETAKLVEEIDDELAKE